MTLLAVFLLGLIATFQLPLAFLPSEDANRISVRAQITRTSPEVLERELIRPLEEKVAGIRDLEQIRVSSGSWGARAQLTFAAGTDIDARKLELRERLDRLEPDLPDFVQRFEVSSDSGPADAPMMRVRIASDLPLAEQYYLIEQEVVRPIERIEGVARVELSGVEPHELEVAVDVEAVHRNGIDVARVSNAVRNAPRGRSLGQLRAAERALGVRAPGLPGDPERIAAIPLARGSARQPALEPAAATPADDPLLVDDASPAPSNPTDPGFARLGDLARIEIHPEEQRRGSRLNGRPAVNLEVYGDAGASTVDVTREVRHVVSDLRNNPRLGDIEVTIFRDQGETILQTLGDLRDTGIYGGIIGIACLFAFLRRLEVTAVAAICIPMSVLAACGVLFLRGEELNCIVLLGLVLGVGMLIDNAVVIVESIQLQLQRGLAPMEAAREGASQVGIAVIASTMSSVIVFLPLVIGDAGNRMTAFLRPLGATFVTGLLASLFVSQTVVPLVMGRAFRKAPPPVRQPVLDAVARAYGRLIQATVRRPRLTLLFGLLLSASAVYPAMNVSFDLTDFEEQPEGLPIRLDIAGSRGYEKVVEHLEVMEQALLERRDELGIEDIACGYRDWGGNCDVYPVAPFQSEHELSDFQAKITRVLPEQPGVRYRINENDHWRGNRDPRVVDFVLRGEDMGTLIELSERAAAHLQASLPKGDPSNPEAGGYDRIDGPFNEGAQEIHVALDPERLERVGVTASQIAQLVSTSFQGIPLGQVRGPEGEVSLLLSAGSVDEEEGGPSLVDLRDLRVVLPSGDELPLGSLASLEVQRSPWWIQRVDRQTEARMSVRFFGDDAEGNRQLVTSAMDAFPMPPGYSSGRGTPWGNPGDASEMLVNLALCLLLVYAVMASLFESFLQPAAILVTCLLGCVGAPWAMWATATTVDTVALIGLFILIGIVVNNGIMLIDRVTQLRRGGLERAAALEEAGRVRLRPILMTVTTTVLGLVPMLIHHPTLAGVYYHSIAIIVAGGLVTSTLMTLLFLPAAYALIEDMSNQGLRTWRRFS